MPCEEKMNLSQTLSDGISWTNGNFWNTHRRGPRISAHRHQRLCLCRGVCRGVCTVLETGLLQFFGYIVLCVFLLCELSGSGNGASVDCLVLLSRLARDVLAAILSGVVGFETVDLLLSLRDVLCPY
jgi:hypothetical protein